MTKTSLVLPEKIEEKIYYIREQRVMLDADLANLYEVNTFNLNKAVKRNIERFPKHFMFQLSNIEFKKLKDELGNRGWGGRRDDIYSQGSS